MNDFLSERSSAVRPLNVVHAAAGPYLDALTDRPVRDASAEDLIADLDGPLPAGGVGAEASVAELVRVATAAAVHSGGPRFYHFVVGGSTPAAMAGDWLTSLIDQAGGLWTASPLASRVETIVLRWLRELFGLPPGAGVLTPSATFANLTGLACARWWWADKHGVDVTARGLAGLPQMPVLASGYVHPSVRKALQVLGCGRDTVRTYAADDTGRLDLAALDAALAAVDGPAVVVASAGEVNTGDYDPIADMAEVARRHGAWLHVDGAFGLFAALSPRSAHLVRGVELADSISADGHKWLNVPYESGFAFVRDRSLLDRAFGAWGAAYLLSGDESDIDYNRLGPESSRRNRAFPIWATLRAYGADGYRAMVERHLDVAARLGRLVDAAPDLELLAPVRSCVVCFRYRPADADAESDIDAVNAALGRMLLRDGRVYAGTTVYRGMTALRPAIVNWRTTDADIDLLVEVVRELGAQVAAGRRPGLGHGHSGPSAR